MRHRIYLLLLIVLSIFVGSTFVWELIVYYTRDGLAENPIRSILAIIAFLPIGILNIWKLIIKSERADSGNADQGQAEDKTMIHKIHLLTEIVFPLFVGSLGIDELIRISLHLGLNLGTFLLILCLLGLYNGIVNTWALIKKSEKMDFMNEKRKG